ncbi:lysophospholipid acyltransferase family protein [Desulfovibrio litoralis]|uniref:Putative hemolysin n=1 Tax=Desulfovibrio litoralis DSM 11393 TaxID=1121455 RepID=A0A1M7SRN6_9BACT|nr:GNAT family N-acyltransferase [Desulfovibrio litoralis]SHN61185.1 Putative hemolysin [Desulfovibrio litoralis DSM 11393]
MKEHSAKIDDQSKPHINLLDRWNAPLPETRVLDTSFLPSSLSSIPSVFVSLLKKTLYINRLMELFYTIPPCSSALDFAENSLKVMNVSLKCDENFAESIPKEGPLVIVSNHPFGGIDGLALLLALLPHRPDLKLLVNSALGIFPDLRSACFPLDILSASSSALSVNSSSLRAAGSYLQQGGAVGLFPSGTVSYWRRGKGVVDPDWQMAAARLAKRYNAQVLPLFFHGNNSLLFNVFGCLHPLLRTVMLPREFYNCRGKTLRLSSGRVVDPSALNLLKNPESITAYLRMRCYALAEKNNKQLSKTKIVDNRPMEPVAEAHDPKLIIEAIAKLPPKSLLVEEGDYAVYSIRGGESPILLEELGALREATFRMVGEGSGKSRDLDIYDHKYYHLLLWHKKDACLVGAYRLGKVQEILAESGEAGLYTSTLFRMSPEFFRRYENSLELGRAVVHPNYQREYYPLMMLWKGIGRFLLRHDDIHCLFGPVSLSLDYTPASLGTVVEYLQTQCGSTELSSMVRGRTIPDKLLSSAKDIPLPDTLNYNGLVALVKDIEGGKGIPVLFKHYLKLGGKIGAFHIDTSFNTLDAFLLMDIVNSPQQMLERYMTPEGAEAFLKRWR